MATPQVRRTKEEMEKWLKFAVHHIDHHQYDKGMKVLDKIILSDENEPLAWGLKGNVFQDMNRLEEALICYTKALDLGLDQFEIWYDRGVLLSQLYRYSEASQSFERALQLNNESVDAWYRRGVSLYQVNRFDEAVKCYDEALSRNPSDVEVLTQKGNAQRDLLHIQEALECYTKALDIDPLHVEAWSNRGLVYLDLEDLENANKDLETSLQCDSQNAKTLNCLGVLHLKKGEFDEGIPYLRRAISIDPLFSEAYWNNAIALDGLKVYDEALKNIEKAIKIHPKYPLYWVTKASILANMKRFEDAERAWNQTIESDSGSPPESWLDSGYREDDPLPGTRSNEHPQILFISHSVSDSKIAYEICDVFEERGVPCWISPRDIRPIDLWSGQMTQAIKGSKVLLLVLSNSVHGSEHVVKELQIAYRSRIPIIGFRIDRCRLPEPLEQYITERQVCDGYTEELGFTIDDMAKDIREKFVRI